MSKAALFGLLGLVAVALPTTAQATQEVPPEMQEFLETLTADQRGQVLGLLQAGVPNGRWKEGLMFDGIGPADDMFSSMQYYPGTEEVLPDEIRVTFMGSSPAIREDQSGMSIFLELGNGDSFIFDLGTGSLKNYMAM